MIWIQAVSVHSEDEEEYLDIYNMKRYARKVTIGQPSTSKDDSDSDSGTKVHSRTTTKSVDPRKEMRTEQKKQAYMAYKLRLNIIAQDYGLKLSFYSLL